MLNEERKSLILQMVNRDGSVTVQEMMLMLDASESTVRRDLNELDKKHLLTKVHGGAVALDQSVTTDTKFSEREILNQDTKQQIAKYATGLIREDDVVFIDAGTTTGLICDYVETKETIFITNAISHARKLCDRGLQVYMPGGKLKTSTEALTGSKTCEFLGQFHFTKGFFGTNGITLKEGMTTPDISEASVKELAVKNSGSRYILADNSKFGKVSTVRFCKFEDATILTNAGIPDEYKGKENVIVVGETAE